MSCGERPSSSPAGITTRVGPAEDRTFGSRQDDPDAVGLAQGDRSQGFGSAGARSRPRPPPSQRPRRPLGLKLGIGLENGRQNVASCRQSSPAPDSGPSSCALAAQTRGRRRSARQRSPAPGRTRPSGPAQARIAARLRSLHGHRTEKPERSPLIAASGNVRRKSFCRRRHVRWVNAPVLECGHDVAHAIVAGQQGGHGLPAQGGE